MPDQEPAAVRLAIEAQQTLLAGSSLDGEVLRIAVGWETLARRFRHDVPTTAELEQAIDVVEDEIGRVAPRIRGSALVADDAVLEAIVRAANPAAGGRATAGIDAVEHLFTRMAARASGSLAQSEALPEGRRFAAALLILRELMHHLRFASVTVAVS